MTRKRTVARWIREQGGDPQALADALYTQADQRDVISRCYAGGRLMDIHMQRVVEALRESVDSAPVEGPSPVTEGYDAAGGAR